MKKRIKRSKKSQSWYGESLSYLKESRNYIFFALFIFVLCASISFIKPEPFSFFDDWLRNLINQIDGLSPLQLISFIFQNNVISAFVAMILGVILGVFPLLSIMLNGSVLGYVMAHATAIEGLSTIWRLVPHGIFELPAIFISVGLGMRLGMFIFEKNKKQALISRLKSSMKVFITIVLPLLIIAAIIEGILISLVG